ncbi:MAG: sugar phosphate nucleotidyltransferase [Clostridia bacterium]|nr:sugar phosphate nucleotidyltransferase [Clostridia bacterium]
MKAIIMAGGEGSRLRPLTSFLPKPMVPVMGIPVMEHIIHLLKRHDIRDIGVTLRFMPDCIKQYFKDGNKFGVNITYFVEDSPLGTAGSVKNAEDFLDDTFLIISGDALTDINLSDAVSFHKKKKAAATLVLSRVKNPLDYGIVVTDQNGRVMQFLEKPKWSEVFSDTANTGIYIMEPYVLNLFRHGENFDFGKDLFPLMLERGEKLSGYVSDGYWCDIGDIDTYLRCHYDVLDKKIDIGISAYEVGNHMWISENSNISPTAQISSPVYIAEGVRIADNVKIEPYSVICENAVINENAVVRGSIVEKNAVIGGHTVLDSCIIDSGAQIKKYCYVGNESIVGSKTEIGERVHINPSIKIWNNKIIDDDITVSSNLVSETHYGKNLFSEREILGEFNVNITPELILKLAAVYAGLCSNGKFAVSSGDNRASKLLYHAAIGGVLSAGATVYELGSSVCNITRAAVTQYKLSGGIHIQASDNSVMVELLNDKGANIQKDVQRKIELLLSRGDFSRCEYKDIKGIFDIRNFNAVYMQNLMKSFSFHYSAKMLCNVDSKRLESIITGICKHIKTQLGTLHLDMNNRQNIEKLKKIILKHNFEITASVAKSGMDITLFDEKGNLVSEDMLTVIKARIILEESKAKTVYVPISAPNIIETVAKKYGGQVVRTKTSLVDMMTAMSDDRLQFMINFDAVFALFKICEYLNAHNMTLSMLCADIPDFYMTKKEVICPSDLKGEVIRSLIQKNQDKHLELSEGVKIFTDKGWALIIPDNSRSVCKIITQGVSAEFSNELADFYADEINKMR